MGRLDGKVCVITGAGGGMGADAAPIPPAAPVTTHTLSCSLMPRPSRSRWS